MEKARLDLEFLQYCMLNNITPNFIKFKLYKSSLYNSQFYLDATKQLLQMEMGSKQKLIDRYIRIVDSVGAQLFDSLSFLDSIILKKLFKNNIQMLCKLYSRTTFQKT